MGDAAVTKIELLSGRDIDRALSRMAHEIIESNTHEQPLALIGIRRRGVPLAKRLSQRIARFMELDAPIPVGELDITLYRDDLSAISPQPTLNATHVPFPVDGLRCVLVDDVIYTGRTARAAMDALIDIGRPACVQLMTLIDRGHRELPIRPDYVGKNVPTKKSERISVCVEETDGEDAVYLIG